MQPHHSFPVLPTSKDESAASSPLNSHDATLNNSIINDNDTDSRRASTQPPLPPSNSQLDHEERELLREVHRIQAKLEYTRNRNQSHSNPYFSRSLDNNANQQNFYSSKASAYPYSSLRSHRHNPPKRVISVSLRLPHNDHRTSARQQLFDAAIPPKAALSLQDATHVPFIWVGSDPPETRTDPDSVVASTPTASSQRHYQKLNRRGGKHQFSSYSPSMGDTSSAYRRAHQNVNVSLPDDPDVIHRYQQFCEHILWRLLHYDYIAVDDPDLMVYWSAYQEVNQRFADTVAEICEEGDIIWVHNFHLMLLPAMLRELVPFARIGFFLYTPFPSAELFRILPYRIQILKGVVASDVIGFHSYDHAKQFGTSARRLLMLEATPNEIVADPLTGRTCKIGIYPGGIDADALRSHVTSKLVKSRVAELRARFEGMKLVVGVDRLDDCFAGLLLKLLAFERLLSDNPHLVGKVILIQAAMLPSPGRSLSTYRKQKVQLNKCVARINSAFGTWTYSPVHFITKVLDPTELYALMCVGHVCVVTTVRDGMGLVPHEWTVCQRGAYNGPIVLSEFSSAAHSFSTALHVNPWDIDEVAAKIKVALDMGDASRNVRNEAAYRFVTSHTAKQWGMNFLDDIDSVQRPPFEYTYHQKRSHHQHHQHQHLQSVGMVAGGGHPSVSSGFVMKPMLDTSAVVHAYLGTSINPPSLYPSPSASIAINSNTSASPTQPSFNIASSPQFVFGEQLSKMMRKSSTVPPFISPPVTTTLPPSRRNNRSSDSSTSLATTDSGDSPLGIPIVPSSAHENNNHTHVDGNGVHTTSRKTSIGDDTSSTARAPQRACLFILDIDGTLMTTGPREKARRQQYEVPAHVIEVIQTVVDASTQNYVMVTSCHSRQSMLRSFGDMRVYLAAEDGAFLREPGSSSWSLLFRDTGVSGGSSGGNGRRHSPGNTVSEGDQYISCSAPKMPVGVAEVGNVHEMYVQSRLVAAVRENLGTNQDKDTQTVESENGKEGSILKCKVSNSNGDRNHVPINETNPTTLPISPPSTSGLNSMATQQNTNPPTSTNGNNGGNIGASASRTSMSTHTSFSSVELGQGEGEINVSWKESVMPVLEHFAERTHGVIIHEGETLVTWEYGDAECDYGHWQSRQVHKHLEQFILRGLGIGISCEEGIQRRWIRVRPKDVDKAKAVQKFIKSVLSINHVSASGSSATSIDEKDVDINREKGDKASAAVKVDFILSFGNDRADEPIFEFLKDRDRLRRAGVNCPQSNIFTCKVGAPYARTAASTLLDGPARVVQVLKAMCGKDAWAFF